MVLVFLANGSSGLWYPDAPSHALNGVFVKDFVADGGILNPVSYAERYYVQYPSLSVGMYPPIFYVVEAVLYWAFGVCAWAAKLGVLIFSLLGATAFFKLCRFWFSRGTSLACTLLYVLQPVTLFGQRNVMLEMPALALSITAGYFLYRATREAQESTIFLAPLLTALAVLTKQNAAFLGILWLVWLSITRRWDMVRNRYFLTGAAIGGVLLALWMGASLTVGRSYVAAQLLHRQTWLDNLVYYFESLPEIISYPVIALWVGSLAGFTRLRQYDGYRFGLVWTAGCLLLLLPVKYAETRFAMFIVPGVIITGMHFLRHLLAGMGPRGLGGYLRTAAMILIIALHLKPANVFGGRDIRGFDRAASYVLSDPDCVSVLYDGYFNSNFVFHMRALDVNREKFVFRASKLIYTSKLQLDLGYSDLVHEVSDFYRLLRSYSIKYIVQEEVDSIGTPANKRIREWLKDCKFRVASEMPLECYDSGGCNNLIIYEFLDYEPRSMGRVELEMPSLGRKILVDVGEQEQSEE